ncbi:GNAT family N-acetyltransferase [Arenibacter sp. 6A1]|uniref:GNAT family N-acetyltransferase n=1 Tax=Arenibacter sp. 6A1 TaxID=2720391 RepID=UPI0014462B42|nr:N-acetyltransferase [Arenibacter sp. 6A1]NKI26963.1 GNAT family N-acetyltransferase [Arenibacter sp. 6A1]
MSIERLEIRNARPEEFDDIGKLLVKVYSQLEGFPKESEQPAYYKKLLNVGKLTEKENTALIVAVSDTNKVVGAVVYFSDMENYGSGGTATAIKNASGFRLLAVDTSTRGKGIGKMLCRECIQRAKKMNHDQLYIHSTESMKIARKMYEGLGFLRCKEIDFMQGELPVYGFRLAI